MSLFCRKTYSTLILFLVWFGLFTPVSFAENNIVDYSELTAEQFLNRIDLISTAKSTTVYLRNNYKKNSLRFKIITVPFVVDFVSADMGRNGNVAILCGSDQGPNAVKTVLVSANPKLGTAFMVKKTFDIESSPTEYLVTGRGDLVFENDLYVGSKIFYSKKDGKVREINLPIPGALAGVKNGLIYINKQNPVTKKFSNYGEYTYSIKKNQIVENSGTM